MGLGEDVGVRGGGDWLWFLFLVWGARLFAGLLVWVSAPQNGVIQTALGTAPQTVNSPTQTNQGRKLTEVINQDHENPKYLPGVSLGGWA
jgi:hypothetical protein